MSFPDHLTNTTLVGSVNPPLLSTPVEEIEVVDSQQAVKSTISSATFRIPEDVWEMIFRFAAGSGRPGDINCLGAIRSVCTEWNGLADNALLSLHWSRLSMSQLHQIQDSVEEINQNYPISQNDPDQILFFNRFVQLTQNLRTNGARIPSDRLMLGVLSSTYEQKQRELDTALETIWGRIRLQINLNGAPVPENAAAIRAWLNNPENAPLINQIRTLNLSNLQLTVLPPEIGNLTQLTGLNLDNNQLTSLPDSIGNLTQLTGLNLENNQLTSLPDSIGNLTQLTGLNLFNNQLTSLPDSIGNLTQLTGLALELNQLTSLPDSIGNLTQLITLPLSNNQLTSLPDSIGNLTQLTGLGLHNNQLTSLPDSIGNLTGLKRLFLAKNQLTSLPDSFGNLMKLRGLFLDINGRKGFDGNLFMFILDKDLVQFGAFSPGGLIKRHSSCTNYPCQTPLADLCQVIHRGESADALMQRFGQLSDAMQQRIENKLRILNSSPIESLFANRWVFTRAVIEALRDQLSELSPHQKQRMYWHIWNLAGKPEGDPNWGENNAESNIIRLIDALGLVISQDSQ